MIEYPINVEKKLNSKEIRKVAVIGAGISGLGFHLLLLLL